MLKKLTTVIPELNNAAIRRTPDGRCSVYDLIEVAGGHKNPRQAWSDLKSQFPEVVQKTDNFKFPGQGQKQTPVTNREGWAYILGLLPGVMGRTYREEAAKLVLRYLDADINIAAEIVERTDDDEKLEWLERRIQGKKIRNQLTRTLSKRGVASGRDYAICTNKTYRGLYGTTADGLRKQKGLPKKANVRNHMDTTELIEVAFAESLADRKINKSNSYGPETCGYDCYTTAESVSALVKRTLGT